MKDPIDSITIDRGVRPARTGDDQICSDIEVTGLGGGPLGGSGITSVKRATTGKPFATIAGKDYAFYYDSSVCSGCKGLARPPFAACQPLRPFLAGNG